MHKADLVLVSLHLDWDTWPIGAIRLLHSQHKWDVDILAYLQPIPSIQELQRRLSPEANDIIRSSGAWSIDGCHHPLMFVIHHQVSRKFQLPILTTGLIFPPD